MIKKKKVDERSTTPLEALYAETFKNFEEGSVIEGEVVAVQKDGVLVDVGYKSEGVIPASEFGEGDLEKIKVGDRIHVYLEAREDVDGNIVLSKEKADRMKFWDDLEKISQQGEPIEGKVLAKVKGGMIVDIGVKAFLPGSQIDLRPIGDLDALVGKNLSVKIIKMNHKRGNIVVSRRALLEESRDKKRQTTLSSLQEGQIVEGTVKNITGYGAFIDLGGIDGLLHITDISWGRVNHPSEFFTVGSRISVVVLKYDKESGRVSLGLKQKFPDPWNDVETKYPVGARIKGKIVNLTDYGAFMELEPGVEGLIHISEMTWAHDVKHPSKVVSVGDQVEAVVLSVDKKGRKISLGMKQVEPNPWTEVERKYPPGTRIEGKVKSLTDFGVFVGLEEGIDGLIHISDISWTRRIAHPSDVFKKGQKVEAIVLKVDREKERISLGYKQLTPDPWASEIPEKYPVGTHVKGRVVKIADFGVFLDLGDGVEGLVHISETGIDPSIRLEASFKVNDEVWAKIIKIDTVERKIALSIREYKKDVDQAELQDYLASQGGVDQTLGEVAVKKTGKKQRKGEKK